MAAEARSESFLSAVLFVSIPSRARTKLQPEVVEVSGLGKVVSIPSRATTALRQYFRKRASRYQPYHVGHHGVDQWIILPTQVKYAPGCSAAPPA